MFFQRLRVKGLDSATGRVSAAQNPKSIHSHSNSSDYLWTWMGLHTLKGGTDGFRPRWKLLSPPVARFPSKNCSRRSVAHSPCRAHRRLAGLSTRGVRAKNCLQFRTKITTETSCTTTNLKRRRRSNIHRPIRKWRKQPPLLSCSSWTLARKSLVFPVQVAVLDSYAARAFGCVSLP